MKFVCLAGSEAAYEDLKTEYKNAGRWGEVRLGERHLFYRYFIKIKFIPYEGIARAYLREESGESGEFLLKEFYLMLEGKDGTFHKLRMEREASARAVLEEIKERDANIEIGFFRKNKA